MDGSIKKGKYGCLGGTLGMFSLNIPNLLQFD